MKRSVSSQIEQTQLKVYQDNYFVRGLDSLFDDRNACAGGVGRGGCALVALQLLGPGTPNAGRTGLENGVGAGGDNGEECMPRSFCTMKGLVS